ncbi:hypothetical protein HHK36_019905 [Tetracentron sinense]|uniref:Uncharacterized protein n=1 Tax=Tetracentron sinense TaxID=13715 RepID=A0A834YUG3_TETSI|nr:hypothetical protein HHK36_019905 [Tetracentron sinense]
MREEVCWGEESRKLTIYGVGSLMKTKDVEDQVAKISVDEQTQITAIRTMRKDLELAKSETRRLKEETEEMVKENGQICSLILQKQKKIASLEADSSTLSQTLELIQQESISLSAKLKGKSSYYAKVMEDMSAKLREHQDWINSHRLSTEVKELGLGYEVKNYKDLTTKLDRGKAKLDNISGNKSKLVLEQTKMKQSIERLKCRTNDFLPELRAMDAKTLEEEHKALLADKAGETEYLQSLHHQIEQLKRMLVLIRWLDLHEGGGPAYMVMKTKLARRMVVLIRRVMQVKSNLEKAQVDLFENSSNVALAESERGLMIKYSKLARFEEAEVRQKARIKWLSLGDRNNNFFHRNLATRRSFNRNLSIENRNNVMLKEEDKIKDEAVHFFENLLRPALGCWALNTDGSLRGDLASFGGVLRNQARDLCGIFYEL